VTYLLPYVVEWASLIVRWVHLITGIAWIGASFYFIWLDNHLVAPKSPADAARGVYGELWSVHGGGFYHSQKFMTGPKGEPLTHDLHWFKWEAYSTWLSGMALLVIVYWFGASTYLVDRSVLDLTPWAAIAISLGCIVGGWFVYDGLCRALDGRERLLSAALFVFVMGSAWGLTHVFSAHAAYLHVGAMLGTAMVANVRFIIIPGQKRMLASIRAGTPVDSTPGRHGKTRSTHNTYFTLPVLFSMMSGHYAMTFGSAVPWATLGAIMLAGVLARQFFVLRHKGVINLWLPAGSVAILIVTAVALAPRAPDPHAAAVSIEQVQAVVQQRCIVCHSPHPTQPGFAEPPKGVVLDTAAGIELHADKIFQTVGSRFMPLGNLTQMTDSERALVVAWAGAQASKPH
jgi:uncharacterized membrane protein